MKSKAEYKQAFEIVRSIIHEWDPYCLLAEGAPDDEFDSEIAAVVRAIPSIKSQADAVQVITRVFSSSFEPESFAPSKCTAAGSKLFDALVKNSLVDSKER